VLNNCALISSQTAKWLPNRLAVCIVPLGHPETTNCLTIGSPPTRKWFETLIVIYSAQIELLHLGKFMKTVRCFALLLFILTGIPALAQLQYVPLQTPCRAVDTRQTGGALAENTTQVFDPGQACGIPSQGNNPIVFAINVTVVPHGGLGALTVYPAGVPTPTIEVLGSNDLNHLTGVCNLVRNREHRVLAPSMYKQRKTNASLASYGFEARLIA
jgi:hypothetical protein